MDADKLIPFWETFSKDLGKLAETAFSEEALERAKLNLEDDLFRAKETLGGLASKLGYFAFLAGGEQGEENYLRIIKDTNQTVLLDLIADLFSPEKLTMSVLLPEDTALAALLPKGDAEKAAKPGSDSWETWFTTVLGTGWKSPVREHHVSAGEGATGQVETIDLGKGRTLVLIPDDTLPYTAMNLVYTGGDTLLSEKDQGLASFTASLLTKGTKERSATAVEDYLSDRAASFSAASGRQTFGLSMDAPARFTDDMFALLYDTLREPAFKDEEAERVRDNQISAITMREDQPTGLAFRRIFPFLFRDHPYGYLQLGEKNRVAQFTAREAREFWKNQNQQPWVLAVCGVFDRDAILAAAQKLPAPAKKEVNPGMPRWNNERSLQLSLPGRNQSHLFMIFPTVGFGNADEPGLELMQNILTGQSGLLFRDLRDEQGLGYTVTAIPWRAANAGLLIFYIGTEPDKMRQAEEGFRKVIADLREGMLPEEELERGKNQMEGDYFRGHQTLASRSSEAAMLTVLHRPLDAARTLIENARGVDAAKLRELARTYLEPDKAYIVKVTP
jgi:zinc protease